MQVELRIDRPIVGEQYVVYENRVHQEKASEWDELKVEILEII